MISGAPDDRPTNWLGGEVTASMTARRKARKWALDVLYDRDADGEFLHWDLRPTDLAITETLSGPQVITGTFPTEITDMIETLHVCPDRETAARAALTA